jgi:hypothetical protein
MEEFSRFAALLLDADVNRESMVIIAGIVQSI